MAPGLGVADDDEGEFDHTQNDEMQMCGLAGDDEEDDVREDCCELFGRSAADPLPCDQEGAREEADPDADSVVAGSNRPSTSAVWDDFEKHFKKVPDQQVAVAESLSIGVNYGQIANNLPSPEQVSWLLRSMRISKVKLYDADPNVLRAFLGTGVEFVVGIGNEYVPAMVSPAAAQAWLQQHVVPYLRAGARITCVTVGNEVFKGNDTALQAAVLPAMQSVHTALGALGLQGRVNVTTAHSLDIMGVSFPPSAGAFHPAALAHLQPFLGFLSATRAPFLINCYPYFAYKDDPARVPLDYVLFRPNAGVADERTGLRYDNMLYAQVDAVYAAIQGLGYTDVEVKVSETGWPSRGDADEPGATPEYAGTYIRNLLQRIEKKEGTPLRPATPVDVYVFALFNENLKPGPASERNYGLFYPDGTPVYNVGLNGYLPPMLVSSSTAARQVIRLFALVAIASVAFVLC